MIWILRNIWFVNYCPRVPPIEVPVGESSKYQDPHFPLPLSKSKRTKHVSSDRFHLREWCTPGSFSPAAPNSNRTIYCTVIQNVVIHLYISLWEISFWVRRRDQKEPLTVPLLTLWTWENPSIITYIVTSPSSSMYVVIERALSRDILSRNLSIPRRQAIICSSFYKMAFWHEFMWSA